MLSILYPWIKSLHIVSMVAWMAGLFYLPRLFVYHADAVAGSDMDRTFQVMERRLLRVIMNPAMILTYVFGGLLLATPGIVDWSQGWIHVKLIGVLALTGFHHALGRWRKRFIDGTNHHSGKFYRRVNEIPTLALIVIVMMVVTKPF